MYKIAKTFIELVISMKYNIKNACKFHLFPFKPLKSLYYKTSPKSSDFLSLKKKKKASFERYFTTLYRRVHCLNTLMS